VLSNQQSTEPAQELVVEYCLAQKSKFRSASCHYALRIAQALQLCRVVLAVAMQLASIRDVFGGASSDIVERFLSVIPESETV